MVVTPAADHAAVMMVPAAVTIAAHVVAIAAVVAVTARLAGLVVASLVVHGGLGQRRRPAEQREGERPDKYLLQWKPPERREPPSLRFWSIRPEP